MTPELKKIAQALVDKCNAGEESALLAEYYHPDCLSIEATASDEFSREAKGLEAIRQKHAWWFDTFEVHSQTAEGPHYNGEDEFAVIFTSDVTHKASGQRMQMQEVALYTVQDGKIIQERFFYQPDDAESGCDTGAAA